MPRRRRPPRPGALADLAPLKILKNIVLLQLAYYATAAVLIIFTALVAGKDVSLDLLLGWNALRGDVTMGWMLGFVWMLNSFVSVIFLLLLVARSKLIPDFALTIHAIHLLVTSFYSRSFPTHWFWWALQAASVSLMISLGMWSCQWRELQPISFGGKGTGAAKGAQKESAQGAAQDEEEGVGFEMARGGRGRDGAGAYEMVGRSEGPS